MRVHHLNCGTLCPFSRRLINGQGRIFEPARLVCHCLLIECSAGLVLVDTGLGHGDLERPEQRLGAVRRVIAPTYDPAETAARQVEALGFSKADVRHIVLTHLDLDHAGGCSDFPEATVHVMRREHDLAVAQAFAHRGRYRPSQWEHVHAWALHEVSAGEPWFGFDAVRQLEGLPPEILMIPLFGHTLGHAGVAISTDDGWLLHCGDAYFHHGTLAPSPRVPPVLAVFEAAAQMNGKLRLHNQARLRELARDHGEQIALFCAHDPFEFDRYGAAT